MEFINRDTKERVLRDIDNLRQQIVTEVVVEVEPETTEIVGGVLFAFMTLSVLVLIIVAVARLEGIDISSEPILASILAALGGLIAMAIGIRTTSKKEEENAKLQKDEGRYDRLMREIEKEKVKQAKKKE